MNLQDAIYDSTAGSGGTGHFSGPPGGGIGNYDHVAVGAFDGGDGLPPDGTSITTLAEFDAYVSELEDKTTQISSQPMGLILSDISIQCVVLGGTGDDTVTADSSVTGESQMFGRSGDDKLTGGVGPATLLGGAGADTLVAGGHGDKLIGGPGADHIEIDGFHPFYAARVGALRAGDVLDFSGAAASFGGSAFKEVSAFDGAVMEVKAVYHPHNHDTAFLFDTDGRGVANYKVVVRDGDYSDYSHVQGVTTSTIAPAPDAHALVV